ncbi:MAG: hypothetical protein AAGF12_33180 [Myxococcota bacterium]
MSDPGPYRQSRSPVVDRLAEGLREQKFKHREHPGEVRGVRILGLLVKKTFNFNLAVIVLSLPSGRQAGPLAQELKRPIAELAGYFFFLYTVGLQVVFVGQSSESREDLQKFVDPINDPVCVLQSIHVLNAEGPPASVRTWGQIFTGRVQDEIERVLGSLASA